jgi:cytochrome c biogenesis protein CcmG/thiol:disulfide interchange protein DsbE
VGAPDDTGVEELPMAPGEGTDGGGEVPPSAEPEGRGQAIDLGALPYRRRRHSALWISSVLGTVAALFVAVLATRPSAESRLTNSPLLGKPSPDVDATTMDGAPFRLFDLQGRWVLVNFFATWCVPCRREHPDLVRFQAAHHSPNDVQVVGVIYSDSVSAVRDFRAQNGGDWPMLVDPDGRIALDFGVSGVPESFLISPLGVVVSKIVGGIRQPALERLLATAQPMGDMGGMRGSPTTAG